MEVPISGLGDVPMPVESPAIVQLMQHVCTASGHGPDGAEAVGVVTGSSVRPMSEWVEKCYLICHAAYMQYFDIALDNYHLFELNNTSSSYIRILSVLVQELGLRINKCKRYSN